MKTILRGNIKDKYEKKLEYLTHYQLIEEYSKGLGIMFRINLFLFVGFYFLNGEYPINLATLDFSFTVFALIFLFYLKPKMLRGEIQAFYRRDYTNMKYRMSLIKFFIIGGVMRFAVLALYYGFTFYLIKDNPYKMEEYKDIVLQIMFNPMFNLLALLMFGLAIYTLFYQERYASIREFSNGVVEIYSSYTLTEEGAVNEFIRRKDEQLKLFNVNGVKYDGVLNRNQHSTKHTTTSTQNYNEDGFGMFKGVRSKEEEIQDDQDLVRRKSRT